MSGKMCGGWFLAPLQSTKEIHKLGKGMKNMNQTQTRSLRKKVLSLILAVVMAVSLLPISAFASGDSKASSDTADSSYKYNIMFLDCGRKYYSVASIKQIIDNASAAGFNYIQLAVGNDGLRFLLDDMSLTVNGTTYDSGDVKSAIQNGNVAYNKTFDGYVSGRYYPYSTDVNELTQSEMDTIIAYANSKGMGVIPCVNTPGHMDAILDAAEELTKTTCSYNGSARTIDVTNSTAVAFTQALLQKYITYFAGKGCQLFNMGADEYANDIYTSGSMGFGNLQSTGKYSYYVEYVNTVAKMIKNAGMKPMAFNDGIYFNSNTSSGTFDTDIIICYWSNGWTSYTPMPAADLAKMGFQMINAHGSYYWVLGKSDWQCDASKASGFDYKEFQGGTIDNPVGSMFLIWCDYPGAGTESSVISSTAATIAAFGKTLPEVKEVETVESKTVTKDNVTVTAPGLTSLTVKEAAAPAIDAAAEGKVVAYDVTPATASGDYEGSGTVTLPIPDGWDASRVRGFVQNTDGSVTPVNGTSADGKSFTFTVPHFSVLGIYELAANAVTETKDITVVAGQEKTVTVEGQNYAGSYTTENPSIATVSVTGTDAVEESVEYNEASVTCNQLISSDKSDWKIVDGYYYKAADGHYYQLYAKRSSEGNRWITYTYTWGYMATGASTPTQIGDTQSTSWLSYTTPDVTVYTQGDVTPASPATTTIIFNGVKEGTTSVIIGNTQYNIKVVSAALASAEVTVEYWITNKKVTAGGVTKKTILGTDNGVYSETGAKFSDLVPAEGTQDKNTDVFWKGTRLTSDNKQTADSGVDKTKSGTDFTYIRYWNEKWSFSADGKSWTDFNSDDQIVAYYLQKTTVTDEVTTEVVDWGELWSGYNDSKYVIVDYAVKYQSGTRSPNSFPVTGKTLGFHCNDKTDLNKSVFLDSATDKYYRSIGMIKGEETANYEVYMITLTPTSDSASTTLDTSKCSNNKSITYGGTEKVVWVDNVKNLGAFADESLHYTSISGKIKYSVGGEPIVPGLEIYNQHGMLVTYYVREKETPDSLHVHYIDTTGSSSNEFYSYAINVHQNTTFDKDIGLNTQWKGDLKNGTVTNIADKEQTVSADLSTMPAIGASYKYSKYTCYEVRRSDDGKDVYLYYTFNNKVSFVVDFGLPLKINLSDLNASLASADVTSAKVEGAKYGTATYADKVVTYTPTEAINAIDTLSVTVKGNITFTDGNNEVVTRDDEVSYMVDIIPATSVYYEDSFATFNNGAGNAAEARWSIVGDDGEETTDKSKSANQVLSALGSQDIYGYDTAYANSTKLSMGSAHKVTVSSKMTENWTTDSAWPTATFTFKGTGFDVISLTDNTSGAIFVDVYAGKDTSGTRVKSYIVDNYYGYTQVKDADDNITWVVDKNAKNALYQIPVMKIDDLTYGEYTAVITVFYDGAFNQTTDSQYNFWLDAIRVYNPMGTGADANANYVKDNEGYPQYIKLRDSLAKDNTATADAVFIDGGETANIQTYANYGPNNEVYLAKGQAITFNVEKKDTIESIQIGAKAPDGKSASMVVNDDKANPNSISAATEMYYEIAQSGGQITITNTGDGILSLTNLKITFKSADTVKLIELTTNDQANAVAQVRALFAEPVEPFNPDPFTASWGHSVRKGDTATLTVKTSEDVESITVDGKAINEYVTRTERTGWGWWAKTVTYREFTYTDIATVTKDYTVCAVNGEGVSSDAITATLTVRPSVRDWLHGIIGKWF